MSKRSHLLFWFIYWLFVAYIEFSWIRKSYADINVWIVIALALKVELCLLPPKMALAYTSWWLLKREHLLWWKKVITLLLTFCIMLACYRAIVALVVMPFLYQEAESNPFSVMRALTASLDFLTVTGLFHALQLYARSKDLAIAIEQSKREKLEAELRYLKNQTNPHFLFNTLNNIYGLSITNPARSQEAIMQLSKILRFTLSDSKVNLVPMQKEHELISNYIALEQLRYSNKLMVEWNYDERLNKFSISPMILLPLVENAFKHGVAESLRQATIRIDFSLMDGSILHCSIKNSKESGVMPSEQLGIGNENVKRQLQLLYTRHSLKITEEEQMFLVDLKIDLTSYESIQVSDH